jgi:hypothetical protein
MLKTLQSLRDFTLSAIDGEIGAVRDVFFDQEFWTVRYLVVNTSSWLLGRNVLLVPRSLGELDNFHRTISVDLTRQQVKDSPDVDTDQPISRIEEIKYHRYLGYPFYWGGIAGPLPAAIPAVPEPQFPAQEDVPSKTEETHLRSAKDLEGYTVDASDGEIGHVDELLITPGNWRIAYLVLKTKNWLPGKSVIVPTQAFTRVDWIDRSIGVTLSREEVKAAPEFEMTRLEDSSFRGELHHYFANHLHV